MTYPNPASLIDHTLLKPDTRADQVRRLCEEAVEYGFASVCIPPVFVPQAAELLYGSEVAVGTVIGFPLGYTLPAVKTFETAEAVVAGAVEIDMVIHLGNALDGHLAAVEEEVRQVVHAAGTARVKVILECCFLDTAAKIALTGAVVRAGAAYVKTSTGFGSGGATIADVELLVRIAAGRIGVKAAGGIRDWTTCRALLAAGATRIGSSAGTAIVDQWRREQGL
ncbi:deoxyribose-phosphate aldolase [Trichloromonas sp.]|uniref:deoxyribose-phosphate aldolase n=1 Tax=Trichloromonas sp. TaxID=3069249 RepID=UPI002A3D5DB2|nr:deoxyribose-phosphate aldolase [Trichloromonas sp.]